MQKCSSPAERVTRLVASLVILGAATARAAWWGPSGTPVAPAVHGAPVAAIADGAGGVLVAYQGAGVPGGAAIRMQRVDASGEIVAGWPADGVVACSLATMPALGALRGVSDGAGGAFLVWLEGYIPPANGVGTAYVQHVLASGQRATGWAARGRLLANGAGQSSLDALPDGTGGVIAAWRDVRSSPPDIRVTRVRANGTNATGFPIAGRITSEPVPDASMEMPALRPDGVSGFWLSYSIVGFDTTTTPSSNHLVHLLAGGSVDPVWTGNGLQTPSPSSDLLEGGTAALADGSGGAYFLTSGASIESRLFHALADVSLDPAWPADGLLLGPGASGWDGNSTQLASDGVGGLYAAWSTYAGVSTNLALRRVHGDGTLDPAWPAPQQLIGDYHQTLLADPAGVFVCGTWMFQCVSHDCWGPAAIARRGTDGSIPVGWPDPPNATGFPGEYGLPSPDSAMGGPVAMVRDGASGVFAAWTRPDAPVSGGYGAMGTVRVMRFSTLGPVADVPPSTPGADTGRLRARWSANAGIRATVGASPAARRLDVYDLLGRRVACADLPAATVPTESVVPGTRELQPGLYFIRVRAPGGAERAKVLVAR